MIFLASNKEYQVNEICTGTITFVREGVRETHNQTIRIVRKATFQEWVDYSNAFGCAPEPRGPLPGEFYYAALTD